MLRTANWQLLNRTGLQGPRLLRCLSDKPVFRTQVPSLGGIKAANIHKYKEEFMTPQEKKAAILEADAAEKKRTAQTNPARDGTLIKNLLFGSPDLQNEAASMEVSFSKKLRGSSNKVHEFVVHDVVPKELDRYHSLLQEVYPRINESPDIPVKLVGSWRTVIGDQDRFIHIWEYDGLAEFHNALVDIHQEEFYPKYLVNLRECLLARNSSIVQEFGSWGGTAKPHDLGGIFELRSYDLKPGTMAEWESWWRKGIEVRRKVMEPVGAWFTSIGPLNRVYHIWQFLDLEHRQLSRQRSWEIPGWAETTHHTVKLIDHMESTIMVPMSFSPLK